MSANGIVAILMHHPFGGGEEAEDETFIVPLDELVILYIAQVQLPANRFCHRLIHTQTDQEIEIFTRKIIETINRVWKFNKTYRQAGHISGGI